MRFKALLAVLASLALADSSAAVEQATIRIDDAWIRWLPAGLPAGGYITLTNIGEKPVVLIAASSPLYGEVSVHRSVNRGGSVEMVPIKQITINPHSSLDFSALGYHLMLMQPSRTLEGGEHVPITLRFADGSSLTVPFDVRKPGAN
jgi:copper(I)-binding protein